MYEIRFNVINVGLFGHINVTFVDNGVIVGTYGANNEGEGGGSLIPNWPEIGSATDGIVQEESFYLDGSNPFIFESVPVSAVQFTAILGHIQSLENSRFDYAVAGLTCAQFGEYVYDLTGHAGSFGNLFSSADRNFGAADDLGVWFKVPGSPLNLDFVTEAAFAIVALTGIDLETIIGNGYAPTAPVTGHVPDISGTFDAFDQCFPADTLIAMWPADAIPRADGTYVTPGHRYLRSDGSFAEIQDIIADDGRIVAADGAIQTVTAEVIRYSAETAHMFEEAEMLVYGTSGGVALAA